MSDWGAERWCTAAGRNIKYVVHPEVEHLIAE